MGYQLIPKKGISKPALLTELADENSDIAQAVIDLAGEGGGGSFDGVIEAGEVDPSDSSVQSLRIRFDDDEVLTIGIDEDGFVNIQSWSDRPIRINSMGNAILLPSLAAPDSETYMLTIDEAGQLGSAPIPGNE